MTMSTPLLVVICLAYILICISIMYFCVIADPELSPIAYFMQVALPNKIWNQLAKVVGDKHMNVVQEMMDRFLVFVYFAVVLGCWSVVFWYIYPWISRSDKVSNVHKLIGYFVFVACFGSWRIANQATPGIITARNFKRYDHYPYDNLLFVPNRRCETTNLIRIPRSKFDRLRYNQNVPRYDHFCGWVFNTIGEENYRWFLLFLLIHVVMCVYGSTVCILLFWGEIQEKSLLEITFFDRATGDSIRSNPFIVGQYLFARYMAEFAVLAVMFVMGIALGMFLGYHIFITSKNRTTNEDTKWSDIKRWHKKQQKKYREAVKKGLVKPGDRVTSSPEAPEMQDGDVTCTGGLKSESSTQRPSPKEDDEYYDPGPFPRNEYDRGFVENWKEVLFPLSRRKNALELGGYSRPRQKPSLPIGQIGNLPPKPTQSVASADKTD